MKKNLLESLLYSVRGKTVISVCGVSFVALASLSLLAYTVSRSVLNNEIELKMKNRLEVVQRDVSRSLGETATISAVLARYVEVRMSGSSRNDYLDYFNQVISGYESVFGAGVWFEPYRYNSSTRFFGPYVYKSENKYVRTLEYESPSYNYPSYEWYTIAKGVDNAAVFSEPFYDELTNITMVTCSAPFKGRDGKFAGVTTVDTNLKTIQNYISTIKIGKTGYVYMVDKTGLCIAHPDEKLVMKARFSEFPDESLKKFGLELLQKQEGKGEYRNDGRWFTGYYTTIPGTGWKLVAGLRTSEVHAPLTRLMIWMIFLSIGILILTVFFGYYASGGLTGPIIEITERIQKLAEGKIFLIKNGASRAKPENAHKPEIHEKNEIRILINSFRQLVVKFREIVTTTGEISASLSEASGMLRSSANSFSANAQSQAAATEQVNATIEEISAGSENIADIAGRQADNLNRVTGKIKDLARGIGEMGSIIDNTVSRIMIITKEANAGKDSISSMNESMIKISRSSGDMTNIIDMITGIADRINLLSLNAAIEAARAGDAGKGFAVVADEISKLADQTSISINEINKLIKDNEEEITKGLSGVEDTINKIGYIIDGINSIASVMGEIQKTMQKNVEEGTGVSAEVDRLREGSEQIRSSTNEQKVGIEEIVKSMSSISDSTQQNAEGSIDMARSSDGIFSMAVKLSEEISYFKLEDN